MNKISDKGIILSRTEFGEKGRILTVLCEKNGKVTLLARGVRSAKSKLAGGIELFSESTIDFIKGRGEIYTITSTRLNQYFGNITDDLDTTNLAYDVLKLINKNTDDSGGQEYYEHLLQALIAINSARTELDMTRLWFLTRFLYLSGHEINTKNDINGKVLSAENKYNFNFDRRGFEENPRGKYGESQIKLLRVLGGLPRMSSIHVDHAILKESLALVTLLAAQDIIGL